MLNGIYCIAFVDMTSLPTETSSTTVTDSIPITMSTQSYLSPLPFEQETASPDIDPNVCNYLSNFYINF